MGTASAQDLRWCQVRSDFTVDGVTRTVRAGDTILKEDGVEHGFRLHRGRHPAGHIYPMREDFV